MLQAPDEPWLKLLDGTRPQAETRRMQTPMTQTAAPVPVGPKDEARWDSGWVSFPRRRRHQRAQGTISLGCFSKGKLFLLLLLLPPHPIFLLRGPNLHQNSRKAQPHPNPPNPTQKALSGYDLRHSANLQEG